MVWLVWLVCVIGVSCVDVARALCGCCSGPSRDPHTALDTPPYLVHRVEAVVRGLLLIWALHRTG